ncbi:MAG: hypothetical protein JOZ44_19670 [Acidobacteria bacterium]|nr:hypothetical protein [Acidobacteriota bacterium]
MNFGQGPANVSVNLRISKTIGLGPLLESAGGGRRGGAGGGDHGHDHGFGGFGGGGMGGMFGGGRSDHRYNLTFSVSGRNIFNRENLAPPVGILSPQAFTAQGSNFGESMSLATNNGPFGSQSNSRRIDLQVQFSF